MLIEGVDVGKKNRNYTSQVYPEEKQGNIKDANKKLRTIIKQLNKKIKQLEESNKTLRRSFNESCEYISRKTKDESLENIIQDVKKNKEEICPKCGKNNREGFSVLIFPKVKILECTCGFKARKNRDERD